MSETRICGLCLQKKPVEKFGINNGKPRGQCFSCRGLIRTAKKQKQRMTLATKLELTEAQRDELQAQLDQLREEHEFLKQRLVSVEHELGEEIQSLRQSFTRHSLRRQHSQDP